MAPLLEKFRHLFSEGRTIEALELAVQLDLQQTETRETLIDQTRAATSLFFANNVGNGSKHLARIMRFLAIHPEHVHERCQFEHHFDHEMTEPQAIRVTASILAAEALGSAGRLIAAARETNGLRQTHETSANVSDADVETFFNHVLESQKGTLVLGGQTFDSEVAKHARIEFIPWFLKSLREAADLREYTDQELEEYHRQVLFILDGLSRLYADPSSDFIALNWMVQYWALKGKLQIGRNLADTGLHSLRFTQPQNIQYRTCLAWLCWAEVSHRGNQLLDAMQKMTFAILARGNEAHTGEWALREIWLGQKIFRAAQIIPFARKFGALRRSFLAEYIHQPSAETLFEYDVADLHVEIFGSQSTEEYHSALAKTVALLVRAPAKEILSLVSAGASVVRLLRARSATPDPIAVHQLNNATAAVEIYHQRIFRFLLAETPTLEELRTLVQHLPDAAYVRDLPGTIMPLLPVGFRALDVACENGDSEMFLLAMSILSQPMLAAPETRWPVHGSQSEWRQLLAAGEQNAANLGKAYAREHRELNTISLSQLTAISVKRIQALLGDDEVALFVAINESHQAYRMGVTAKGVDLPRKIAESAWSARNYDAWRKRFPKPFSEWEYDPRPFPEEKVPESDIRSAIAGLSYIEDDSAVDLRLFPTAMLLGFVHNLAPSPSGSPILSNRNVDLLPSVAWYMGLKERRWQGNKRKVAWLGSLNSQDINLNLLRSVLTPSLTKSGFELLNEDAPISIKSDALVVAVSHGGTGFQRFFEALSDRVHEFSTEAFASYFQGCGCVVLFVCNAGSAQVKHQSADSHGLAISILANGVRVVIACPWPLTTDSAREWLPAFLAEIDQGIPVRKAAWSAAHSVRSKIAHLCGWAPLHVYGDGDFIPVPFV